MSPNFHNHPDPNTMVAEPTGPNADQCPRCQGHLRKESDKYGPYQECLECGYTHDLPVRPAEGVKPDKLMEGASVQLIYVGHSKKGGRRNKIATYRYHGTALAGTEIWRPDCPFDGEVMRLGATEEKTEAKGEINFRCSRQHSIWVTRYGKAWR